MFRYERWNLLFIGLIFVVTTLYAVFAGFQWKTMRNQLALTDRPWLKISLEIAGPLKFIQEKTMIRTSVRVIIKNIGRSVATNIRSDCQIYIAPVMKTGYRFEELEFQKNIFNKLIVNKIHPLDEGLCLFPDDEQVWIKNLDCPIKGSDFINVNDLGDTAEEFEKRVGHKFPSGYIYPLLIVCCVDYQFDTSPDHHQSGIIYRIIQTMPSVDVPTINHARAIKVGDEIPINELKLTPYAGAGRKAN